MSQPPVEINTPVVIGLAAVCMARGLTREQGDEMQRLLATKFGQIPSTVSEAMAQIDAAIREVVER